MCSRLHHPLHGRYQCHLQRHLERIHLILDRNCHRQEHLPEIPCQLQALVHGAHLHSLPIQDQSLLNWLPDSSLKTSVASTVHLFPHNLMQCQWKFQELHQSHQSDKQVPVHPYLPCKGRWSHPLSHHLHLNNFHSCQQQPSQSRCTLSAYTVLLSDSLPQRPTKNHAVRQNPHELAAMRLHTSDQSDMHTVPLTLTQVSDHQLLQFQPSCDLLLYSQMTHPLPEQRCCTPLHPQWSLQNHWLPKHCLHHKKELSDRSIRNHLP